MRRFLLPITLSVAWIVVVTLAAPALAAPPAVTLDPVPGSFDRPVYVVSPPGDAHRLFVVEKTGRIRIVKDGAALAQPFIDLSRLVSTNGERGLLSMAFSPDYASNGKFFVNYTDVNGNTRVVRYTASAADPDRADTGQRQVIMRVTQPYANHNGGQLQFGPDGRLYVGMGDGGSAGDPGRRAQNSSSRLGKLLRIKLGAPLRISTYAKGLRNPWRFSFDRSTGALWIGDVGQGRYEEVDYLRPRRPAGANFGWNGYEGTHVYNRSVASNLVRARLTWPVNQYSHSVGESITGGFVYRGSAIPELIGYYVFGDYITGRIWAMDGPTGRRQALPGADNLVSQLSSFGEDASGELYAVSLSGTVYKIVPAP